MAMDKEEYERMARLETELEGMKELLVKMDAKLDTYANNFVPRNEIQEMLRARDASIEKLERNNQTSKTTLPVWFGFGIAVVTAIVAVIGLIVNLT